MEANASAPQTPAPSTPTPTAPASPGRIVWPVLAAVATVAFIATLVWALNLKKELGQANTALEAHLKTIVLQTQQVEALDRLAVRIDKFNREFGASLGKLQMGGNLEEELKALQGKAHVPEEAKKTLEEFEQSVAAIDAMSAKVKEYERYLGTPMTVAKGDSHSQLAKRYLLEEAKLSPTEADQVLRKTALAWEARARQRRLQPLHRGHPALDRDPGHRQAAAADGPGLAAAGGAGAPVRPRGEAARLRSQGGASGGCRARGAVAQGGPPPSPPNCGRGFVAFGVPVELFAPRRACSCLAIRQRGHPAQRGRRPKPLSRGRGVGAAPTKIAEAAGRTPSRSLGGGWGEGSGDNRPHATHLGHRLLPRRRPRSSFRRPRRPSARRCREARSSRVAAPRVLRSQPRR
ncbi:MAG: hypothetical protein QM765_40800 [Myxococcales bacterium]